MTAEAIACAPARAPGLDLRRAGLHQVSALLVLALLVWLTRDRITTLDTARIGTALASVSIAQWALGVMFTGVSFWAVGRYDAVVHRLLGTAVTHADAVRSGAAAIAVAQTLGMGVLTGALARLRLLPGLTPVDAMRVSLIVTLSFFAGWAVLAAGAVLVVPMPLPAARGVAGVVLAAAATLATLSLLRPAWARALPSLRAMTVILGLAALDTLAAGTVLWVLLPNEITVSPTTVLAAYLLALGAGLVLTTPGGVGPFEVALLALLPELPQEPLLAAVIAYRALYYATPATLGALVLLRGPHKTAAHSADFPTLTYLSDTPHSPPMIDAVIDAAPRAEAGLLRHGRLGLLSDLAGHPTAMAAETGQCLVALGDPLCSEAAPDTVLDVMTLRAKARFLTPVLYKSSARFATRARARGWVVAAIAEEAWIDPRSFSPDGAARSRLRRKLRKAQKAGLTISAFGPDARAPLPLDEMEAVAQVWAKAHGGERGFSMGTWDPDALGRACIYLAHDAGGILLGFITVHANAREHTLDLMRARADAPDGMMQALIAEAIAGAARAGMTRFSLAAVPRAPCATDPRAIAFARGHFARASGAEGLRQFKAAFAPNWEPLYAAAPTQRGLALAALDLGREIARPAYRRS